MNPNDRTVMIHLPRGYVCRLLVLLAAMAHSDDPDSAKMKWKIMHDKIREDLANHDKIWGGKKAI